MQFNIFLIINPGLEDLALEELNLKCPAPEFKEFKGGIEIYNIDLDWIVNAHCLLKIPTRILMRICEFKVKDFPKLYSKFLKLNWNNFLSHPEPIFEISCTKSRLFHTDKIEQTIKDALAEALKRQAIKEDWKKFHYSPQTLYIRIFEDQVTLSLDLSGDPLYKRGLQPIKGDAPLRENISAALVFELLKNESTPFNLVDPMSGSGTLLYEGAYFYEPLHLRKFQFEEFPFFKGKHFKLPSPLSPFPIKSALGFDINAKLISHIKEDKKIKLSVQDSLVEKVSVTSDDIFICNPPYGERIQIQGKKGVFLIEALEKFLSKDSPRKMGWLIPRDFADAVKVPENYQILSKRDFRNGGLAVSFWIFERKF